jgi:hypothetical protein
MSDIIQKIKDIKELIVIIISVISVLITGWGYITTKFALKEHVDYSYCVNDKQIKIVDSTMRIYNLNEALSQLYEKQSELENKIKSKKSFKEYRELLDLITQHKTEITNYELIKKEQDARNCLKEIGYVK